MPADRICECNHVPPPYGPLSIAQVTKGQDKASGASASNTSVASNAYDGASKQPLRLFRLPIQSLADWIGRAHPIRRSSPLPPSTFQTGPGAPTSAASRWHPTSTPHSSTPPTTLNTVQFQAYLKSNCFEAIPLPPLPPSATLGGPHGSANSVSLTSISTENNGSDDEHGSSKSPGPNAASSASYTSYTSYTSDGPKLFDGLDHTHPEMTAWLMISLYRYFYRSSAPTARPRSRLTWPVHAARRPFQICSIPINCLHLLASACLPPPPSIPLRPGLHCLPRLPPSAWTLELALPTLTGPPNAPNHPTTDAFIFARTCCLAPAPRIKAAWALLAPCTPGLTLLGRISCRSHSPLPGATPRWLAIGVTVRPIPAPAPYPPAAPHLLALCCGVQYHTRGVSPTLTTPRVASSIAALSNYSLSGSLQPRPAIPPPTLPCKIITSLVPSPCSCTALCLVARRVSCNESTPPPLPPRSLRRSLYTGVLHFVHAPVHHLARTAQHAYCAPALFHTPSLSFWRRWPPTSVFASNVLLTVIHHLLMIPFAHNLHLDDPILHRFLPFNFLENAQVDVVIPATEFRTGCFEELDVLLDAVITIS
ncbi:hypothetical protein FB451DRAFT_1524241 [Mycena latifolia]|nr:hypothetical protein FB451DRAFT_1524241 [Mycena latifolia]